MKQPEVAVWTLIDPSANLTRCYNNLEDLLQLHQDTWTFTPSSSRLSGGTPPRSRRGRSIVPDWRTVIPNSHLLFFIPFTISSSHQITPELYSPRLSRERLV